MKMAKKEEHEEHKQVNRPISDQERPPKSNGGRGKGVCLALLCAFLGSIKGLAVSKIEIFGAVEIFGLRCLGSSSFIFPFIIYKNYQVLYDWKTNFKLLLRSIAGNIAVGGFYFGFCNLPLGDASVIFYSTSIYTSFFGCLCLKEQCGWKEILSVTMAMAGVTLVTSPTIIFNRNSTSPSWPTGDGNSTAALVGELYTDLFSSMNSFRNSGFMESHPERYWNSLIFNILQRNNSLEYNTSFTDDSVASSASKYTVSAMYTTDSTIPGSKNVIAGIVGAFVGAIAQALTLILLRTLHGIPAAVTSFWWSVVGTILCFPISFFTMDFRIHIRRIEGLYIILVAATGFFSELCLVVALLFEEAGRVSLVLTSEIIWALVLQIAFQNEKLTIFSVTGAAIMIASIVLPSVTRKRCQQLKSANAFRSKNTWDLDHNIKLTCCSST